MASHEVRIGVREFRAHLADYLRQAREGRSFVVISRGEVIASVGPPTPRAQRKAGALAGRLNKAIDFDASSDEFPGQSIFPSFAELTPAQKSLHRRLAELSRKTRAENPDATSDHDWLYGEDGAPK